MISLLVLKATVLLVLAILMTRVMSRVSAIMRHTVWLVSLLALLVIPVVYAFAPLRLPILPVATQVQEAARGTVLEAPTRELARTERSANGETTVASTGIAATGVATPSAPPSIDVTEAGARAAWWSGWTWASIVQALLVLWAVVAAALTAWLGLGLLMVRRIVRRSTLVDDAEWTGALYEMADRIGLEHAPVVRRSAEITMPFACGLRTPTIVLPAESASWSADERTAVMLHELAHIKRRDLVAHTVSRIACALYWFHPLVWTAAKRLRAESEQACDDLALLSGAQASDYAEHLLEIVTRVKHSRTPAMAMAMATRSEFEGRMLAILDPERRRRGPSRLQSVSLVGSLVALTMVVGLAAPAASRAASPAPRPAALPTTALAGDTLASDSLTAAPHTNARSLVNTLANGTANGMAQTMADTGRDARAPLPDAALLSRRAPASLPVAPPADAARPAAPVNAAVQLGLRVAMQLGLPIASAASGLSSSTMTKTDSSARAKILATVLRGDTSASLRRVAAWGLEPFVSEPAAAQALMDALRRDADPAVREVSAWALSSSDHAPAVREALIAAAQRESVPLVLRSVVRALGEQGDQNDAAIADALVSTLDARSATSAPVREMTAWALGMVSPAKAPAALLALLRDSDVTVRKTAAWAVHAIEDERAVPALVDAMRSETDPNAQFAMVRALASLGDAAVPALTKLLDDKNPAIRGAAVRSLAGGGSTGPWPMPRPEPRPNPGR